MSDAKPSPEWSTNLWAPWRMEYIETLGGDDDGCFLCDIRDASADDERNLLIWRSPRTLAVLNRFPYTGGHTLIAPLVHAAELAEFDDATLLEMMAGVRDVQAALTEAIRPHGFNVGINLGRCAGAGLPGHLHIHVVPRWNGDTNFMSVFGDVRVIPVTLEKLAGQIRRAAEKLGLPNLPAGPAPAGQNGST